MVTLEPITEEMRQAAGSLLEELQGNRLEVCLIAGRRLAVSHNAEWYSRFCGEHERPRRRYPKLRTIIKRRHTVYVLRKFINGTVDLETVYAQRLLPIIEEWLRWQTYSDCTNGAEATISG